MEPVKSTRNGHIGALVLDDPEKRNALSKALVEVGVAGLKPAEDEPVRVVVLRAPAGVNLWSAGHDVGKLS